MTAPRSTYTISVGYLTVHNVEVVAHDADDALAKAEHDWRHGRQLRWYECPDHDAECHFQVEDVETEGTVHGPF